MIKKLFNNGTTHQCTPLLKYALYSTILENKENKQTIIKERKLQRKKRLIYADFVAYTLHIQHSTHRGRRIAVKSEL